ncbi:MAG: hypothetical protein ACAI25_13695 [Planctomycetota bacterium]
MKTSLCLWSLAAVLGTVGCFGGTAGGPGAVDADRQPIVGQADDTFQLRAPQTTLRQGETQSVSITIKRALNFKEDVTLAFAEMPRGLTVDNKSPVIKSSDSEARLVLTATDDASLGEFSLKITGHPTKGTDATNKFNITVTKK